MSQSGPRMPCLVDGCTDGAADNLLGLCQRIYRLSRKGHGPHLIGNVLLPDIPIETEDCPKR